LFTLQQCPGFPSSSSPCHALASNSLPSSPEAPPLKDHIERTENVNTVNLYATPPAKLSLCGEDLPPPTSHHPPPTYQSRSLQQIQSGLSLTLH
ncbi:hypothetical protein CRENBAI_000894, partial [Crenichthys baileyi]